MKTSKIQTALALTIIFLGSLVTARAASTEVRRTTNVTIPDNGGWVSSPITISGVPSGATVTRIDVSFECIHPYSADLVVDLNADAQGNLGTYNLWNREGGAAANPSRTRTNISTFNALSVNRTWYLYARDYEAGDGGYIDEWTITVYYEDSQSDIVVQGTPSISPNPVTAGNSISVSYTIKNQGSAAAGSSETKIQIKNSSGTQITAPTFSEGALSAGGSASRSRSVTIPSGSAAGTYTAYVILDNDSDLDQSNTSNDFTPGVNFGVSAPVQQSDIVVQGTPSILPNPVSAGNSITVSYTIKNQDSGNAGSSETKIQIKNSSGTQITAPTFSEGSLSAGASASRSRSVTIPGGSAAGTYTAFVILDNQSELDQSNTSNDFTPGVNFTVSAPVQQSDIVVQGTPSISPNPVTSGNAITVSYTIANQGSGNAGSSETKIQIKNSSGTQITAPIFSEGSLTAGASASRSRSVTIPSGSAAGTYTAFVILDNQSELDQSNTTNDFTPGVNFAVSEPTQQSDIVVEGTPSISPNPVTSGNAITVSYTIANQGSSNAGASQTKIQIKNSSGTQITAATFSEGSVSAGGSALRSRNVTIPSGSAAGTYTAFVILDNQSELDQSSEENDFGAATFAVASPSSPDPKPDIRFKNTPTTFVDNTVARTLRLEYWIENNSNVSFPQSRTRVQIVGPGGGVYGTSNYTESALGPNSERRLVRTIPLPSNFVDGQYTVSLLLDSLQEAGETSEGNNSSSAVFSLNSSGGVAFGEPCWVEYAPSPFHNSRNGINVDSIVIHTTNGTVGLSVFDRQANFNFHRTYFTNVNNNNAAEVAPHYLVGPSGEVVQFVDLDDAAVHARYYNSRSIGIEVAGWEQDPDTWSVETIESLKQLVLYLSSRFQIPLSQPPGDANTAEKCLLDGVGIVGHHQIQPSPCYTGSAARSDPGIYFPWSSFVSDLQARAGSFDLQVAQVEGDNMCVEVTSAFEQVLVVQHTEDFGEWEDVGTIVTQSDTTVFEALTSGLRGFVRVIRRGSDLAEEVQPADRFDYPIGDRGNNPDGTPRVGGVPEQFSVGQNTVDTDGDPETNDLYSDNPADNPLRESYAGGWRNSQDVGAYFDQADGIHPGEDWNYGSDDIGLPIYAVANGVVKDIAQVNNSSLGGAGYAVVIRHTLLNGEEIDSVYIHIAPATKLDESTNERQSEVLVNGTLEVGAEGQFTYQEGDAIMRGDKIGVIADIDSVFDHLHFEMRDKPIAGLPSSSNAIDVYWPSDDDNNVYYGVETTETTMLEDNVRAAYVLMRADGIIDPSDFIDENRGN